MPIAYGTAKITVSDNNLVYVAIDDRAVFDDIALPVSEGECLSRTLEQAGGVWVIFQYWGDRSSDHPIIRSSDHPIIRSSDCCE
jgi:hypothetical protein